MQRLLLSILSVFLIGSLGICQAGQRGVPATNGIPNFAQVNERLYRGAQPDEEGIKNLQRLGIKSIISLRHPGPDHQTEAATARAQGLVYTNMSMSGLARPKDAQVHDILSLIETLPGPVFIHCQHGCDRTGTIIACYRIKHDGWEAARALAEARTYGMAKADWAMRRYVKKFAKSVQPPPVDWTKSLKTKS